MKIFRNFDFASKYYDYQTKLEYNDSSDIKIAGWYKFINGQISALFVNENRLYILFGDNKFLVTDDYFVEIYKGEKKNEYVFLLKKENVNYVKFNFSVPEDNFSFSPFEYIDEDDFKWGNFIEKIINNPERKRNFISNLME